MSSYVCNNITIATVAIWAAGPKAPREALQKLGQLLLEENGYAFDERYEKRYSDEVTPFELPDDETLDKLRNLDPTRVVGVIRGYRYQLAEYTGWEFSPAALLAETALEAARSAASNPEGEGWTLDHSDL